MTMARIHEKELVANIEWMCRLESSNPGSGGSDFEYLKSQLNQIKEERYRGALTRARAEKLFFR